MHPVQFHAELLFGLITSIVSVDILGHLVGNGHECGTLPAKLARPPPCKPPGAKHRCQKDADCEPRSRDTPIDHAKPHKYSCPAAKR